jgi:hypothetical protein
MDTLQAELCFDAPEPSAKTLCGIVLAYLRDGKWVMPWELCAAILHDHKIMVSDSSLTARIRQLRNADYGGHIIEKRIREGSRGYEYRMVS